MNQMQSTKYTNSNLVISEWLHRNAFRVRQFASRLEIEEDAFLYLTFFIFIYNHIQIEDDAIFFNLLFLNGRDLVGYLDPSPTYVCLVLVLILLIQYIVLYVLYLY